MITILVLFAASAIDLATAKTVERSASTKKIVVSPVVAPKRVVPNTPAKAVAQMFNFLKPTTSSSPKITTSSPVTTSSPKITTSSPVVTTSSVKSNTPTVKGIPNVSYITLGGGECINFSQLVGIDVDGKNVTKRRQASGASNYGDVPSNAVDGNERPRPHPQIYHSREGAYDTFQVKLDRPTEMAKVILYNRADGGKERMTQHRVKYLDSNKNVLWTSPPLTKDDVQTVSSIRVSTSSSPVSISSSAKSNTPKGISNVSYIRLLGRGGDGINVSQLIGYDTTGANVTKGRKATGYESPYSEAPPSKAVDGSEVPRGHPNQYHSGGGPKQYLEVKLSGPTNMSAVKILNRADCCQDRMKGNVVQFLDANRKELWVSSRLSGAMTQTVKV